MKSPMQAFVGVNFDCEFNQDPDNIETGWFPSPLARITCVTDGKVQSHVLYHCSLDDGVPMCRPRLNKDQVLTDYAPILVDGFVWDLTWYCVDELDFNVNTNISSYMISRLMEGDSKLLNITFKGVEKGSEYEDWAVANDVPIYNKDMEVVA